MDPYHGATKSVDHYWAHALQVDSPCTASKRSCMTQGRSCAAAKTRYSQINSIKIDNQQRPSWIENKNGGGRINLLSPLELGWDFALPLESAELLVSHTHTHTHTHTHSKTHTHTSQAFGLILNYTLGFLCFSGCLWHILACLILHNRISQFS